MFFFSLGILKYVYFMLCVCVVNMMDVMFSVYIVRRGTIDTHVWEV